MYWTNNEGKSVIAEIFIRALKTKIYKYMTEISKNVYIDKINDKDAKFKVGDYVRISKYKNIFVKEYIPNWSLEIFIFRYILWKRIITYKPKWV